MSRASSYQQCTDFELVQNYHQSANAECLSVLFQRYSVLVFGVCMKYLRNEQNAKDSTQFIFEKCIDELRKYEVTYFKSWLYMIAKNHCLMQLRKANQHQVVDIDDIGYALPQSNEIEEKKDLELKNVTLDIMHQALEELEPHQRQCIIAFYLQKKNYQQIMDEMQLEYMKVKSYIQNGKRNLKIAIEKKLKQHHQ